MIDYYSMPVNVLISEMKKKDAEIERLKTRVKKLSAAAENVEIIGRQNRRLKKDCERYRQRLDRTPRNYEGA